MKLEVLSILIFAVCSALFSNAIQGVAEKWEIKERFDLNRPKWLPDWCDFCAFFWYSVPFVMLVCAFGGYSFWYIPIVPFVSLGLYKMVTS